MSQDFPVLRQTVLDCVDARGLAEFYRQLLGYAYRPGDEPPGPGAPDPQAQDWLVLCGPDGAGRLAFQPVAELPEVTWPGLPVPQQLHLDLTVPTAAGLEAQHERALALGARLLLDRSDDPEEPLRVYADPAGHPFCIFVAPALVVQRLGPEDWSLLRGIRLTALSEAPHAFSSTLARERDLGAEEWRSRLTAAAYFAGWQDGEPAGLAAGLDDEADPGRPHLVSMWVSPRARGGGLAEALVAAVTGWARDRGAAALVLWVTDANPRARAFYRRMGYRSTGLRQLVRPEEPDHWEEQMARELR